MCIQSISTATQPICMSSMVLDPVIVGNLQTTTLSISVSNSSPAVGQAFTYTGYLMNAEGIGLSGKKIDKQCRLPSGAWKSLGSTTTDVNGRYVATYTEQLQARIDMNSGSRVTHSMPAHREGRKLALAPLNLPLSPSRRQTPTRPSTKCSRSQGTPRYERHSPPR